MTTHVTCAAVTSLFQGRCNQVAQYICKLSHVVMTAANHVCHGLHVTRHWVTLLAICCATQRLSTSDWISISRTVNWFIAWLPVYHCCFIVLSVISILCFIIRLKWVFSLIFSTVVLHLKRETGHMQHSPYTRLLSQLVRSGVAKGGGAWVHVPPS